MGLRKAHRRGVTRLRRFAARPIREAASSTRGWTARATVAAAEPFSAAERGLAVAGRGGRGGRTAPWRRSRAQVRKGGKRSMTKPSLPRVLLIEDDDALAERMKRTLEGHFKWACTERCGSLAALANVDLARFDVVVCDDVLPDGRGLDAVQIIISRREELPVVLALAEDSARHAVGAVRMGAADCLVRVGDFVRTLPAMIEKNLELARIRRDNLRLQAALSSSLAELKRKNRELEEAASRFEAMATTDLLTSLANRRRLDQRLGLMFSEAVRYGQDLTCLMIDLDGFKSINDTLGHQRGDELLMLTGRIINEQIRSSDLGARYGGDEFVVILPHTGYETAISLGRRLVVEFQKQVGRVLGEIGRCGMSIGLSSLSLSRPLDAQQLIAHADSALYTAKLSGRSRIMVCGPDGVTAMAPESLAA